MSTDRWQTIAVAVMLVSLPLLAWGGNDDVLAAAIVGGAVFALGAGSLTVLRYIPTEED